jgi:hypothetical protein
VSFMSILPVGKELHSVCWMGGWVGPRAGLDMVTKKKYEASAGN